MRGTRYLGPSGLVLLSFLAVAPALFGAATWLFGEVTLESVRGGTLGFVTEKPGVYLAAPTVHQTVELSVNGPLLRGRVTQRFHNPSAVWQEAVYLFPLPDGAAVDRLKMIVGNRIIEGRIKEKEEARRTYETAKAEGKKAALAEQSRPDVFQMTLANIGPGEFVDVEMEYGQVLDFGAKGYALRFPLVVAERYTPASVEGAGLPTGTAPSPVPDAPRVAEGETGPTVDLTVDLDAGFPLGSVASPSHDVAVQSRSPERRTVTLAQGVVPADRDFVLEWAPERGDRPRPALLTEAGGDGAVYALALVLPPRVEDVAARRLPRDMVLVIDTSGSMDGESMEQARASLLFALTRLHPEDSFDVVDFDSTVTSLFNGTRPATPENLAKARDFVTGLKAGGGTEMLSALKASLPGTPREGAVRQVVFITDGQVNDEERLFAFIEQNLRASRLFTVGIGSAPNTAFMKRAAAAGRGTFTFVGKVGEVEARMAQLFRKLENPVMADVAVDWNAEAAEAWPAAVPDLYADEPLVLAARLTGSKGPVKVTGRCGDQALAFDLPLPAVPSHGGVGKLWANRKIEALLDRLRRGSPEKAIKDKVVAVALEHGLVTRYTSLVAVDVTPTKPEDAPTASSQVPLNTPAGSPAPPPMKPSAPSAAGPSPGGPPAVPEPAEWLLLLVTLGIITWSVRRDARPAGRVV